MAYQEESGRNKLGVCYVAHGIKEQLTKIGTFKRACKIYDSDEIFPYSCYLPLLSISFLFVDFENDFKDWTGDKEVDKEKILELAGFVKNSPGKYFHLVYLCSSVDEILISIAYGVERSVKKQLGNLNAFLFYGVAKTWSGAVRYMLDVSKNHWIDSLDQQYSDFQTDLDHLQVAMEEVVNQGKKLISLRPLSDGDTLSDTCMSSILTDVSKED